MGIKKIIIYICLSIVNLFIKCIPIKQNRITFVSLESNKLEFDLKDIYTHLNKDYDIKQVLIHFDKNTLWTNFLYFLNTFKQIYYINTSKVVLITDNNYVISKFKRKGVKVIQVWHATGAIKKFGNEVHREYPIQNYDYIIANSDYWKGPYSKAFGVEENQVIITGMPRVDHLLHSEEIQASKEKLYKKYPILKNKKIILYAPTFRGNIYNGFTAIHFDAVKFINSFDEDTLLLYKYHPLLHASLDKHERIINMNKELTHDLFAISDMLISDFSSIIFDYSLLDKPMYFYVPDLDNYLDTLGCFVDYKNTMPGEICYNEEELVLAIKKKTLYDIQSFRDTFFTYQDGKNVERVIQLIEDVMK